MSFKIENIDGKQPTLSKEAKLNEAIEALFNALTCVWEDNGNIMGDAVKDQVTTTLAKITGKSFNSVQTEVDKMVEQSQ